MLTHTCIVGHVLDADQLHERCSRLVSCTNYTVYDRISGTKALATHEPYLLRVAQESDSFPFKWIKNKWSEGFYVTCMATSHTRWVVVMSRTVRFIEQVRPPVQAASCQARA